MLHKNPLMADIDVDHWRNMQSLLLDSAKGKRRIIVIHENGEILKFVHTEREEIIRPVDRVDNPQAVAEKVYKANPGKADFVMVVERRELERYFGEVQNSWRSDEDLDVYVHRMFSKLDEYPAAVATYPNKASSNLGLQWRVGSTHEEIEEAVKDYVPANSTFVLGVFENDALWATLVLGFDGEKSVDNVTTVDPTELKSLKGWKEVSKEVVEWVSKTYTPVSIGLFMDLETARKMFATADKKSVLKAAAVSGKLLASPVPQNLAQLLK
jgi:hypothetical protein